MINKFKILFLTGIFILVPASTALAANNNDKVMADLSIEYKANVVMENNFNEYTGGAPDSAWKTSDASVITSAVKDSERGTSLRMESNATIKDAEAYYDLPQTIEGKIVMKGSFNFDTKNNNRPLFIFRDSSSNGNENYFLRASNAGKIELQNPGEAIFDYNTDTWYDILVVIDIPTRKFDLYVNGVKKAENRATPNNLFTSIKRIYFLKQWNGATVVGHAFMDDVGIYKLEPLPKVLKITAQNSEGDFSDVSAIPFTADSINLEFSKQMNGSTLNISTVRLTVNDRAIPYKPSLSANGLIYKMELTEVLKPSKTYNVVLSSDIKDSTGANVSMKSISFITKPDIISAIEIKRNGEPLKFINEIMPGDAVTISANAVNQTSVDATALLIVAYFKDNRMIGIEELGQVISGNTPSLMLEKRLTLPDVSGYNIKLFAWQNAASMNSYIDCQYIE